MLLFLIELCCPNLILRQVTHIVWPVANWDRVLLLSTQQAEPAAPGWFLLFGVSYLSWRKNLSMT